MTFYFRQNENIIRLYTVCQNAMFFSCSLQGHPRLRGEFLAALQNIYLFGCSLGTSGL